ncbi:MAG: sulfotransferase [Solirubrobacterales bacterium]
MTLFVQGMRRSGTTILYDALLADPALHCFYEPFREDDVTVGGGSGARPDDAFAETRALREAFRLERYPDLEPEEFNWGGPREPSLEVGPALPEHCTEFVRSLLASPGDVAVKFTRAYDKLGALARVDADAALVHVIRDPRAVVASIMFGRGQRRAGKFPTSNDFFGARSKRRLWSCRGISQQLVKRPEYAHMSRLTDVERILLVWRHTFESTWRDGTRLFGDRYLRLDNEELRADPDRALRAVYATLEREPPEQVLSWAAEAVLPGSDPYEAENEAWLEAFARVRLRPALSAAGYGELAERVPEPGLATKVGGMARRTRRRLARFAGR